MSDHADVIRALLDTYPRTYAQEAGADPSSGRPQDLYRTLCVAVLASARISADLAISAARALADDGLTSPEAMRDAGWQRRVDVLNGSGYARYDESTSRMLGDGAELVLDRWDGDLRNLREEAERDPGREHQLLQEVKGIGDTGATIFCREVQGAWTELRPLLDDVALRGADAIGLPTDADRLAGLVATDDLPLLASALVRVALDDDAAQRVRGGEVPLARRSKEELYEAAQEHDVPGRSSMTKEELVEALADR